MGVNTFGFGFDNPHGLIHTKTVSQTHQMIELHFNQQWRTHFEACKQSDKLMVIYFTAAWCGPCRLVEPYVNQLAGIYTDVVFVKIDVDKIPEAAVAFELVDVMPTFILARQGIEIDRVVGAKKEELKNNIEKHRNIPTNSFH